MKNFFDKFGFLQIHAQPGKIDKENSWWRTGQSVVLNIRPVEGFTVKALFNFTKTDKPGVFKTYPESTNTDLSFDDYTLIYCIFLKLGWDVSELKIIDKGRLHPRDLLFYSAVHIKERLPKWISWVHWPLLAFHNFFILWAFLSHFKFRNGVKILKTDQRITAFCRMVSFNMGWSYKFFTWMIKHCSHFGSWNSTWVEYFGDDDPEYILIKLTEGI